MKQNILALAAGFLWAGSVACAQLPSGVIDARPRGAMPRGAMPRGAMPRGAMPRGMNPSGGISSAASLSWPEYMRLTSEVAEPKQITFTTSGTSIDCEDLGGPLAHDLVPSQEWGVEVDANVPVSVTCTLQDDLKAGRERIPTLLQLSAKGLGLVGCSLLNSSDYTEWGTFDALDPRQPVAVSFARKSIKGLRARVLAERNGLNDKAGHYSTEIVLSWCVL